MWKVFKASLSLICIGFFMPIASALSRVVEKHIVISSSSSHRGTATLDAHPFIYSEGKFNLLRNDVYHDGPRIVANISITRERMFSSGLHLLVLHQRTGRLLLKRSFETHEPFSWWADLLWWMIQIVPGRLVIMTVSGYHNSVGLRHARILFSDLGSLFCHYMSATSSWTWAFVKGGRTLYETINKGHAVTQEILSVEHSSNKITSEGVTELSYVWFSSGQSQIHHEHMMFCDNEGGMGSICDEQNASALPRAPQMDSAKPSSLGTLDGVKLVITAGNRHQYLYKTISDLVSTTGLKFENIFVVLGDTSPTTLSLLHLLNLSYTIIPTIGHGNSKLFLFYRSVYQFINCTFTDAPAVIILDEDVEVSQDFFIFISETLWLLLSDPSLYCINGYSVLPNAERGRGERYVRRGAVQVSWGYVVTLDFVREALKAWPEYPDDEDILTYDYWLYDKVRGDRECIYPEVSRIRHYGLGMNTDSFMHEYEAWYRPLLRSSSPSILNAFLMPTEIHEKLFVRDIQTGTVVEPTDPCGPDFPPELRYPRQHYVMYYHKDYESDISTWYILGQCLGLHAVSEQGHHHGAFFAYIPLQSQRNSVSGQHTPGRRSILFNMTDNWHPVYPSDYKPPHHFPPKKSSDVYGMNYYVPGDHKVKESSVLIYFVGVPYSKYSYLKAENAFVYNTSHLTFEERDVYGRMFLHDTDILLMSPKDFSYQRLTEELFNSKETV